MTTERRERGPGAGFHSISNKLLIALLSVAVLPTVAVSIYAIRQGTVALSDLELSQWIEGTTRDSQVLVGDLDVAFREVQELAERDALRQSCLLIQRSRSPLPRAFDEEENASVRRELLTARSEVRRTMESLEAVESIFVVAVPGAGARSLPLLRCGRGPNGPDVRTLQTVNAEGYLVPTPDREQPLDLALQRDLGREVAEHPQLPSHRATVVSDGEVYESFMVTITTPDTRRRKIGNVIVTLSWRRLLEARCISQSSEARREAALFDGELRRVAQTAAGAFDLPDELHEAARSGLSGAHQSSEGILYSFAPLVLPLDAPHEFSLLAFRRAASRQKIREFRNVFSAVLSGALIFGLLLGTYLSRRMTRPLRSLQTGAAALGAGELQHRIPVTTRDEVAEVAVAFNKMAGELRSLYAGMEQTIHDRTEQLQEALDELRGTHRELVESEARYSEIVESASDLIQVTDAEGRILRVNQREAELLGQDSKALVGQDFFGLIAEDQRLPTRAAFQSVVEGGTLRSHPSALGLPDGRRVPLEISATPILRDGVCLGVRAIMRDVSERKEMESQLLRAERLSSVGALAAGVAHEINNPLGIITMFAQRAVERGRKGEVDLEKLEKIVEQARRVAQITRGLLDFSRAAPTEFRPFDLGETVRETLSLVAERAKRSGIELRSTLDPVPPVMGNAPQISQVLLNLLLNALHAIGERGSIDVRVGRAEPSRLKGGRDAVLVVVDDSGPGISDEALPLLFEPFFTTKEPGEGTGLGLSVAYGILKEHHGVLLASNRGDGGARFEFELPVADA